MSGLTAILAGATGLVGSECLRQLLVADEYDRVIVLARRDPGEAARHPKVRPAIVEIEHLGGLRKSLRADHVFCALGTTMAKAGSKSKFREVDFEYPLRLAQMARMNGARHFSIVSALGAGASSPFFYSRVKGEVEQGLGGMEWPSLAIFRPSVIAGDRAESRPLERLSGHMLRFAPATWRPIAARDIAAAMVATAIKCPPGVTVIESRDIPAAARGGRRFG